MLNRDFIDLQQALAGEYSLERELGLEVRERFLREARLAASLSHPHIVPIYRVGETAGFVFFVMAAPIAR